MPVTSPLGVCNSSFWRNYRNSSTKFKRHRKSERVESGIRGVTPPPQRNPSHRRLDVSRIPVLDWKPRIDLKRGIGEVYEWFIENSRFRQTKSLIFSFSVSQRFSFRPSGSPKLDYTKRRNWFQFFRVSKFQLFCALTDYLNLVWVCPLGSDY